MFATSAPTISIDSMTFEKTSITLDADTAETADVRLNTTPGQANSPSISYASSDSTVATVTSLNAKEIRITAVGAGTATITATAGEGGSAVTATLSVTVTGTVEEANANTLNLAPQTLEAPKTENVEEPKTENVEEPKEETTKSTSTRKSTSSK